MDPVKNPFFPGAGTPPPELAGRQSILDKAHIMFERLKAGRSEKSFLLIGLLGVGKTVLLTEIYRLAQKQLPLALVGAGLPQLVGLTGRSKSYAERLFDFPKIGPLGKLDAITALRGPANEQNVEITDDALAEIMNQTQGYPYFLQEWGYQAWNLAEKSPIDLLTVNRATQESLNRLDESFFRVRFDSNASGKRIPSGACNSWERCAALRGYSRKIKGEPTKSGPYSE